MFSWLAMGESPQMGVVLNVGQSTTEACCYLENRVGNTVTDDGTWKATCLYELAEIVEIRSKDLLMQKFI